MQELKTNKAKIYSVLIVAFVIVLILKTFVIEGFIVNGDSMSPTIMSGDYVFINKLSYTFGSPKRGDIIVGKPRVEPSEIIKRIVGMPGEKIQILDGHIQVKNDRGDAGSTIDESYLNGLTTEAVGTSNIQLDPNEYFVLGDNRGVSIDSRELGPIDRSSIKGKVFADFSWERLKLISF